MQKTRNKPTPVIDLMSDIMALQRAIYQKATECGLARHLINHGALTMTPHGRSGAWSADVELSFQPNHGIEYKLTTPVTDEDHAWPIDPDQSSDLFVEFLKHIHSHAEATSASRRAIKKATLEVIAEAAQEGISLEPTRIEAAPILVYGSPVNPNSRGRDTQVFYVHLMMPHDDAGTLTEDSYTIDADDAEEFASYLRHRTLPELRTLLARFSEPAAA